MNQQRFVSEARSKKDIMRNLKIMLDCVIQKPQLQCMNLAAEDTLNSTRQPMEDALRKFDVVSPVTSAPLPSLEDVPRSKNDVRRNAMKFTGDTQPVQPSRLPPADAPRSKRDVKRNALKLKSEIPFVSTQNTLLHIDNLKRKSITAKGIADHSPYLTSSYNNSTNNTCKEKISTDLENLQESNWNSVCRFCLRQPVNAIQIDWHSWKDSKLALLYEQITNIKLHISKDCSELCCIECSRKLHTTFQTIQLFREANAFWQDHLIKQTQPIEEVKLEEPEYNEDAIGLIDYLDDNTADDVIFTDEPITVVDGIPELKCSIMDKTEVNLINVGPIKAEEVGLQTETIERNFDCKMCDKVYKTARGLADHNTIHESMEVYGDICNKKSTVHGLRKHTQRSHGDINKDLECKICGNISNCFNNWKAHQLIHIRSMDTIIPCDQCGKVFLDRRLMKAHKRVVHDPYVASMCNECGKVFRNRERLHAHMLLHGTPSLQCDHCKTMFKSKKYIIEHMRVVHKQGQPHICDKCGQEFQNKFYGRKHTANCLGTVNGLKRRYRGESLKNSLNCQLCMRPYLVLATLQNHYKKNHTVEECELLCMQCNRIFASSQAFSNHKNTAHANLQCTVCKKVCLSEVSLRIHMNGHGHLRGQPRFDCKICGGSYARLGYLKMHHRRCHTTERPFKCDGPGCDLAFADKYNLLQHKQNKHAPMSDRPHVCIECGARFITATRLRYHLVSHTGIGTFKCFECGDYFRYSSQLETHVIAKHPPVAVSIPGP